MCQSCISLDMKDAHPPSCGLLDPLAALDLHAEAHLPLEVVLCRHIIKVSPEFASGWKNTTPVGVGFVGVAV